MTLTKAEQKLLGTMLRARREALGMAAEEIAFAIKTHHFMVRNYEEAKDPFPYTSRELGIWCRRLGWDLCIVTDLVTLEEPN
jgi:hypothetical protein